jgi:ribosomal protein S15P/S13E
MSYDHDQERGKDNIDQYLFNENSTLPDAVQDLMLLIFDIKMMQTHMKDIGYDEKRSPLGLIARSAI